MQVNLCGLLPFALDINEVNKELVKHRERMGYSPDTCTVFTPGHRRALISLYGADLSTACTGSQSSRRRRAGKEDKNSNSYATELLVCLFFI